MGGMPGSYEEGLSERLVRGRGGGETLRMETALFGFREKVGREGGREGGGEGGGKGGRESSWIAALCPYS